MSKDAEFTSFVLDQLHGLGAFETKSMFGGTALLRNGNAFAKIKHGCLWLKADDSNRADFLERGMPQYTYGKDNSRKLNFFQAPPDILEDTDALVAWIRKSEQVAQNTGYPPSKSARTSQ